MSNKGPIIESIYDTEIFLERRRRITLKDVFIYDHLGLMPVVVYIAQAEAPEPDGTYRHGHAFYDVKSGKAVSAGSLFQQILFNKLPKVSRLADIDTDNDFPEYDESRLTINRLLESLVKNARLTKEETAEYLDYLDTMQDLRPEALTPIYDFFRQHIPVPRPI